LTGPFRHTLKHHFAYLLTGSLQASSRRLLMERRVRFMRSPVRELAAQWISERSAVETETLGMMQRWCIAKVHARARLDLQTADFLRKVIPELLRHELDCADEYDLCEKYSRTFGADLLMGLMNTAGIRTESPLRLIVVPTGDWDACYSRGILFFSIGYFYVLKYYSTFLATMGWIESLSSEDETDNQRHPTVGDDIVELRRKTLCQGISLALRFFRHFSLLPDLDAVMPLVCDQWEDGMRPQQKLIFEGLVYFVCLHEVGHSVPRSLIATDVALSSTVIYPESLNAAQLGELAADRSAVELSGHDPHVFLGAALLLSLLADMEPREPVVPPGSTHPHAINRLNNIYSVYKPWIDDAGLGGTYSEAISAFLAGGNGDCETLFRRYNDCDDATLVDAFFECLSDLVAIAQDDVARTMFLTKRAMKTAGIRATDEYGKSCMFCESWDRKEERCQKHGLEFNGESNTCDEWGNRSDGAGGNCRV
jgi:hypothetical protein